MVDTAESAQRQNVEFVEIALQEVKEEPNWREEGGVRSSFRHGLGVALGSVSPSSCWNVESLSEIQTNVHLRVALPTTVTLLPSSILPTALTALSYLYPMWLHQVLVRGSES